MSQFRTIGIIGSTVSPSRPSVRFPAVSISIQNPTGLSCDTDWAAKWKTWGSKPRRGKIFFSTSKFEVGFEAHSASWVTLGLVSKKTYFFYRTEYILSYQSFVMWDAKLCLWSRF